MTATSDREIVTTRVLDAARELVWRAWTDPLQVAQWWGPNGFTNTIHEMDVRPGGVWKFVMHGPDGTDYDNMIVFEEVVEPERLVYAHGSGEDDPDMFHVTLTFAAEGGKTRVALRALFASAAERDKHAEFGAVEGGQQTLERLARHLAGEDQLFVIMRSFDAARELVWKAYTEPERLMQWWGPKGFTMLAAKVDLRPGGIFHYGLSGPNNQQMWGKFVYREIAPPERLVFVVSFSDEEGGTTRHPYSATWPLEVLNTVTFSERDGKTTLTLEAVPVNANEVERKTFAEGQQSLRQGSAASLDQLEEYLAGASA